MTSQIGTTLVRMIEKYTQRWSQKAVAPVQSYFSDSTKEIGIIGMVAAAGGTVPGVLAGVIAITRNAISDYLQYRAMQQRLQFERDKLILYTVHNFSVLLVILVLAIFFKSAVSVIIRNIDGSELLRTLQMRFSNKCPQCTRASCNTPDISETTYLRNGRSENHDEFVSGSRGGASIDNS